MERRNGAGTLPTALEQLRERIDSVDEGLVDLMATRTQLAREAGAVKAAAGLSSTDLAREAAVVRRASSLARERGVEPEVARDVFWRIISLSKEIP